MCILFDELRAKDPDLGYIFRSRSLTFVLKLGPVVDFGQIVKTIEMNSVKVVCVCVGKMQN